MPPRVRRGAELASSRETALTRPSDHGGSDVDLVPAAPEVGDRVVTETRLDVERAQPDTARDRTTRSGGRCASRVRRSPPAGSAPGRRGAARRAAPTAPAGRRRACRRRATARRRAGRAPATASCAGACPARATTARPSSSQNICARVPSGQPSAGDRRRALQPAAARRRRDEVAEAVRDVEVDGVAARRLAGAERRC